MNQQSKKPKISITCDHNTALLEHSLLGTMKPQCCWPYPKTGGDSKGHFKTNEKELLKTIEKVSSSSKYTHFKEGESATGSWKILENLEPNVNDYFNNISNLW